MWDKVVEKFDRHPSQIAVVREFLRLGISVKGGKAYCGTIELIPTKIADAIGVDRKVVVSAIQDIESDEELTNFWRFILLSYHLSLQKEGMKREKTVKISSLPAHILKNRTILTNGWRAA